MHHFLNFGPGPASPRNMIPNHNPHINYQSSTRYSNQLTIRTQPSSPRTSKQKIKLVSPSRNSSPSNRQSNYNQAPIAYHLFQNQPIQHNNIPFPTAAKGKITLGGRQTERSPITISYQNRPNSGNSPRHFSPTQTDRPLQHQNIIPQHQVLKCIPQNAFHNLFENRHPQEQSFMFSPKSSPQKVHFANNIAHQLNQKPQKVASSTGYSVGYNIKPTVNPVFNFKNHQRTVSEYPHNVTVQYKRIQRNSPKQIFAQNNSVFVKGNTSIASVNVQQPTQIQVLKNSYENQMRQIKILQLQIAQNNLQIKQLLKTSSLSKKSIEENKTPVIDERSPVEEETIVNDQNQTEKIHSKQKISLLNSKKDLQKGFTSQDTFINQLSITTSKKIDSKVNLSLLPREESELKNNQSIQNSQQIRESAKSNRQQRLSLTKNNQCEVKMMFKIQKPIFEVIPQQSIILSKHNHEIDHKIRTKHWNTDHVIDVQIDQYLNSKVSQSKLDILQQLLQKEQNNSYEKSQSRNSIVEKNISKMSNHTLFENNSKSRILVQQEDKNQIKLKQKPSIEQPACQAYIENGIHQTSHLSTKTLSTKEQRQRIEAKKVKLQTQKQLNSQVSTNNQYFEQKLQKSIKAIVQQTMKQSMSRSKKLDSSNTKMLQVKNIQYNLTENEKINDESDSRPSIQFEGKQILTYNQNEQISFSSKDSLPQSTQPEKILTQNKQSTINIVDISRMTQKIKNAFKKVIEKKKTSGSKPVQYLQPQNKDEKQNTNNSMQDNEISKNHNLNFSDIEMNPIRNANIVHHGFQSVTMPSFYTSNVCSILQSPNKKGHQKHRKAQTLSNIRSLNKINNKAYL